MFEATADGVVVTVLVQPNASRAGVAGVHDGMLRVRVSAPAEQGRANRAVAAELARWAGVRPSAVRLVSGATSRRKRFLVVGAAVGDLPDPPADRC